MLVWLVLGMRRQDLTQSSWWLVLICLEKEGWLARRCGNRRWNLV
jgi:hypothetical protein